MKNNHINEDQLINLVIDRAEMSHTIESHLLECSACQKKIEALEKDLTQVGVLAQKYTPGPRKTIRYEPEKSFLESSQPWFFRTSFAAAVIMAVLIIGIWFIPFDTIINDSQKTDLAHEDLVDQQLMAEIWEFEEEYLEDLDSYFDEEFLEFILPLEEENNSA